MLRDLFAKEWHTEATVDTADAEASFRGFYGDYLLKVVHDGKESEHHAVLSSRTDNRITITL